MVDFEKLLRRDKKKRELCRREKREQKLLGEIKKEREEKKVADKFTEVCVVVHGTHCIVRGYKNKRRFEVRRPVARPTQVLDLVKKIRVETGAFPTVSCGGMPNSVSAAMYHLYRARWDVWSRSLEYQEMMHGDMEKNGRHEVQLELPIAKPKTEREEKIDAQRKLCKDKQWPFFAPTGTCFRCSKDIWEHISFQKASTQLITGCPCCFYSYCE